jgi:formylmethanofuran dehydrogenase subunit E
MKLTCQRCGKRLSRKTARQIDGVIMCSACMFPPLKKGLPEPERPA